MARIVRDPSGAAGEKYDLIIIGGGIYGVMLSFEASKRGLHSLLLERDDFGSHTSFNSLRIIHGGLRYLQTLDIPRFVESVQERSWFLKTFPELVKPLPCLMPLYGNGLKRPSIFRAALWANHLLSINRNKGLALGQELPAGGIIDPDQTRAIFQMVDPKGLKGAAVWYDAIMPDSQLLLMRVLRWSCELGATALNYVEAKELLKTRDGAVAGVVALDRESGRDYQYKADVVVNAAGPWCRELGARFDRDEPSLFLGSLVWNVLLDRRSLSSHALAVAPRRPDGRIYFLVPWKGKVLAGTGHAPLRTNMSAPSVSKEQITEFLDELNFAVPGFEAEGREVLHVFSGLLPVKQADTVELSTRPVVFQHGKNGGPRGFYSVSGVKFTTARRVADKTLSLTHPTSDVDRAFESPAGKKSIDECKIESGSQSFGSGRKLQEIIQNESVLHLDDLVYRRTDLWERMKATESLSNLLDLFGWDAIRSHEEVTRLRSIVTTQVDRLKTEG
jgi:glycerol-3-phosphate dehydrogenase